MTRNKDNKAVYVLFEDGTKSAEFALPEGKLMNNRGFSEEDVAQLKDYVCNEKDEIFSLAKTINPIKAFLGE